MPSRNSKSYIAVVAVAAAVGFAAPAVAPVGFAAAPASALATGPGEGAGRASTQDVHLTHLPAMYDDPHGLLRRRGAIGRPVCDRHRVRVDRSLEARRRHGADGRPDHQRQPYHRK